MATMQTLTPQPNFAYYGKRGHWLVVIGQHRDSDTLDRSNFRVIARDLQGRYGEDVAIERASHFLVGWAETLLVNPCNADAVAVANEWREKLEGYPVANEDDYSELESEELEEQLRVALIGSGWFLGDDGTLDTVLECADCGHEERFSDREAAIDFLYNDRYCPSCAENDPE